MLTSANLSLEQAPPISVPFRFFLTAPLFAVLAAVLLLGYGSEVVVSRWGPVTLAFTHLITLGFLSLVMCGAILQMLPVLGGAPVPAVTRVGTTVHILLSLGTAALSAGFVSGADVLIRSAVILLGFGFVVLVLALLIALRRVKFPNPAVIGIGFALIALVATVVLGVFLGSRLAWPLGLRYPLLLTDIHIGWGLLGWVGMLIIGVGFQVVPMFLMTPEYPKSMHRLLLPVLLFGLLAWTFLLLGGVMGALPMLLPRFGMLLLAGGYALFAITTLQLQLRRTRRVPDVTLSFWRTAMITVLICVILLLAGGLFPAIRESVEYPLFLGAAFLSGFAFSVVNGMLYKIVPFLSWFHLQHRVLMLPGSGGVKVPNMKEFIPDRLVRRQFTVHLVGLVLAGAAVFLPDWFARPAGFALGVSAALLWYNLARAVYRYRQVDRRLNAIAAKG